jgi:hypothetical protein
VWVFVAVGFMNYGLWDYGRWGHGGHGDQENAIGRGTRREWFCAFSLGVGKGDSRGVVLGSKAERPETRHKRQEIKRPRERRDGETHEKEGRQTAENKKVGWSLALAWYRVAKGSKLRDKS